MDRFFAARIDKMASMNWLSRGKPLLLPVSVCCLRGIYFFFLPFFSKWWSNNIKKRTYIEPAFVCRMTLVSLAGWATINTCVIPFFWKGFLGCRVFLFSFQWTWIKRQKSSQRIFLEGPHVFDSPKNWRDLSHIFAGRLFPLATTILSLMGSVRHLLFAALDMANNITMGYFSSFHLAGRGFGTTIYTYTPVSLISYCVVGKKERCT